MTNTSFFDEPTDQSLVKATIVAKYFWAWAKVIIPQAKKTHNQIGYIDLFSGPGCYKDGSKSTPILILEKAINDPDMQKMLVTMFNDSNTKNTQLLEQEINCLPNLSKLAYKPIVLNEIIGDEIVRELEVMKIIPTLFFIDPYGYKGLSLKLITSVIKNWGCDCIFFFNYNRINMGLNNELVKTHMNSLFGEDRADTLRVELELMKPYERELTIIEAICQALKEIGGVYSLPFRFKNEQDRTSHHLFFVSKHVRGYSIMKDIMAKESSSTEQGVPSFEYNPATINQPLLFELSRPLDELANMLMDEFAGQTLNIEDIYNKHHVGRRYIQKNYREVLLQLESQNKITTQPPANKRRKGTLGKTVSITFPSKEED